jgi:hypothetical protein
LFVLFSPHLHAADLVSNIYCAEHAPSQLPAVDSNDDRAFGNLGQKCDSLIEQTIWIKSAKPYARLLCEASTDSTPVVECVNYNQCGNYFSEAQVVSSGPQTFSPTPGDQMYHIGVTFFVHSCDRVYFGIYGYH